MAEYEGNIAILVMVRSLFGSGTMHLSGERILTNPFNFKRETGNFSKALICRLCSVFDLWNKEVKTVLDRSASEMSGISRQLFSLQKISGNEASKEVSRVPMV